MNSLGVIETRGLTAAIQAADAACKAANVEIIFAPRSIRRSKLRRTFSLPMPNNALC